MEEPDTGARFGSLEEELEYWREQAARNNHRFGSTFLSKPPKTDGRFSPETFYLHCFG